MALTIMEGADVHPTAVSIKESLLGDATKVDAESLKAEDPQHQHNQGHSHHGGGCCSGHGCVCAMATRNIVKCFLPLLSEERQAELMGWIMSDETWGCVPNSDAPPFAFVETVYSFKYDHVVNEQPTVNSFMKVLNTLNHHVKALPSRFFSGLTYTTDLSQHGIDEKIARIVIPTHRFGAWVGILIEMHDQRATIFDPCATLSDDDLEEIKGRLSVFNVKEHHVMTPKRPIHMRYSVVAVCTGLEVLARAGFAKVAPPVFGKLSEMIGLGGNRDDILEELTEEIMHADDSMTREDKLAAMLAQFNIDHESNVIATQFADRIAWSLATCELNAPKWECGCAKQAAEVQVSSDVTSEGGSDKENLPMPEPDHSVEEPAFKKHKE
ncbi:hypothetical protein CcaverHIS002_0302770 [Cutaneotrichosporon cavernicola]|nr:hypothetical protein CcaverHIS002_0302770 [Cutaneotrichosporon cavernicola]BEI97987.1 hypothetical protein CcaverHIS631_0302860 [Cutaneotrichosporon cavernicola]BEJ05763.1 hypothetical protein CcaverHIS641_0302850 [Cutaneotrichosporon cavernicola]